jgi:GNAT superfamily N-acetyltransferase
MKWELRAAGAADIESIADLRAVVMRPDLERFGRYDEIRVRQRFRDGFSPGHTMVIEYEGELAGCVTLRPDTLRPDGDGLVLEHFMIDTRLQGRGIGAGVLAALLERADDQGLPVRLTVFKGSAARRIYDRHGFVPESEDAVDDFLVRTPAV